jgi:hypothetical protein
VEVLMVKRRASPACFPGGPGLKSEDGHRT